MRCFCPLLMESGVTLSMEWS